MKRHKNVLAHDETESIIVGDVVRIEAIRPLSKCKSFTVAEVMKPARRYLDPATGKIYSSFQREPIGIDEAAAKGIAEGKTVVLVGGEESLQWRFAKEGEIVEKGRLQIPSIKVRDEMLQLDQKLADHLHLASPAALSQQKRPYLALVEGPSHYLRKMWTAKRPQPVTTANSNSSSASS